jgi:Secretion system C-terminal sorting domain
MAQYAPQAGLSGSSAISASSPLFTAWGKNCTVTRGLMNIADPTLGYASAGDSSNATGAADDLTVSLGDSGIAIVTFSKPIANGSGADFAVFENGFLNPDNDSQAFLELGFVEVSTDGSHYVRFPATSLTPSSPQITNDGYMYANLLNNLAGNYKALYGTPFDLEELADSTSIDVHNINYVRIIDVIGNVSGTHTTYDAAGKAVNDPYPTPFPSCGFDLDAVGVINQATESVSAVSGAAIRLYPNPATDRLYVETAALSRITITDIAGQVLGAYSESRTQHSVDISGLWRGTYFVIVEEENGAKWVQKLVKL